MDCCTVETQSEGLAFDPVIAHEPVDDARHICKSCHGASRPVARRTVLLMLKPDCLDRAHETEYRFCSDPDCRIVYFTQNSDQYFTIDDLRVRVGLKQTGGEIPLCYCFGFNESDIREEIMKKGQTFIPERIGTLIKQKMCECASRNPSGACCLGEVRKVVKRLTSECLGSVERT